MSKEECNEYHRKDIGENGREKASVYFSLDIIACVLLEFTLWGKIIANHTPDKFISKLYEELMQFNSKREIIWFKKWANDLNRHFYKANLQMTNNYLKRCSTPLITGKRTSKPQ